ncbi:Arf guanine nucleotide exchange factor syt1 [Cichlidogyrus casuarinus]|uniref:Arf guanine nucleotide exchange factor syt1 n=1 Tax=Cichlidogyrus casuarinus TaxID=1844966 RepID=A0ABD2QFX4_9PLAT
MEDGADSKCEQQISGKIEFSIEYFFDKSELTVCVMRAIDLPAMDLNGSSDPYYAEVAGKTLVLSIYDFDRFSKHDQIGQVKVPLSSLDLAEKFQEWREIEAVQDKDSNRLGEICFSLRYVPTSGRLNINILEARNLKKMDVGGLSDPYVKISLLINGKRVRKKKTSTKMFTLNPYYNESFAFELPFDQVPKANLIVSVVDYDRIGNSEPIGRVILGCNVTGAALSHWTDMLTNPRRPIANWHTLQEMPEKK